MNDFRSRALQLVMAEPWAILPESLEQIIDIAARVNDSPEAVAARLGRPLENTRDVEYRDGLAIVPVIGPIFRRANLFTEISGATSLEILARDFNAALSNDTVNSIVLDISSPGGQAAGISEFAAMVRASHKPVTAYVGDTGASAAYWIASAAHEVVVSDTSILGSIGVVASFRPNNDGKIKIVSSQSPMKQADPTTEQGRAEVQRVVDDLAAVFVASIAMFRGVSSETVLSDFGKGSVLVGKNAVAAGMADRIGSFESIVAGLSGASLNASSTYEANTGNQKMSIESLEKKVVGMDRVSVEQQVVKAWSAEPSIRAEFGEQETAVAYFQQVAVGRVRVANSVVK